METKTIQLSKRTLTVKKLPLKKYVELLKAARALPKKIQGLEGITQDVIFERLPEIIADSLPEFVELIVVATDLESEYIYSLGLDEVIDIVLAVVEVNNYKGIYDKVKNAMARPAEVKAQTN